MSHNCGCPQNSPSQLTCPPTFSVPVDQFNCDETNLPPQSANSVTYHQALSAFVVPAVGQQSALLVADGTIFAAGQWLQFVNPSGIFRIISITGNTLQLQNAAADGITEIAGNPFPPYQYPYNAAFVAVGDPRQQSLTDFATHVQDALATLQSVCFDNLDTQSPNEEVYLLGYLKTNLCNNDSSACLRKQELAYIDNNGVLHFDGPIVAEQFNIPVPEGGLVTSDPIVNPNNGTGGGFLLPLYNPSTGQLSYVNIFSGLENGEFYGVELTNDGKIKLSTSITKSESFWPEKVFHEPTPATAYTGLPEQLIDVGDHIDLPAGEQLPTWVKWVTVRLYGNLYATGSYAGIQVSINDTQWVRTAMVGDYRCAFDATLKIPLTNRKFKLKIIAYQNVFTSSIGSGFTFSNSTSDGADGFVKMSILEISSQ